jgi:hypothetical protein
MARSSRGATLLFWLMTLTGGGALAACLILPAWLEHQATLQLHAQAEDRIAELEARLQVLEKQIEHLRHDPAYVERLAREEFGLATPGVQTILLDRPDALGSQPAPTMVEEETGSGDQEDRPELSAVIGEMLERYPGTSVFVLDQTRPIVMVMSAVLLLAAILLLHRGRS